MQVMPTPEPVTDVDGAVIGEAYETEIGALYALGDGGYMLTVDAVMERSDLESLYHVIGAVLQRGGAPAVAQA